MYAVKIHTAEGGRILCGSLNFGYFWPNPRLRDVSIPVEQTSATPAYQTEPCVRQSGSHPVPGKCGGMPHLQTQLPEVSTIWIQGGVPQKRPLPLLLVVGKAPTAVALPQQAHGSLRKEEENAAHRTGTVLPQKIQIVPQHRVRHRRLGISLG